MCNLRRLVLCLASIVVLGAGVAWGWDFSPNTDPSLMGLWKLDEGTGTTAVDSSGRNHNGTLNGNPQWVAGKYGGALSFSGSNYVDTGYTENLATWTVCCWATSPAAPASASPSGPVHREGNYQLNWNHTDANFRAATAVNAGGTWYAASYGPLEANRWYFVVGTYDGQDLKAYRDGVLISTNSSPSGAPNAESNSLKFARHAASAQFFTGTVDDVRVYNRALTLEEIKIAMTGGINPGQAANPSPKHKATDVHRDAALAWTPGKFAQTQDVYLGTSPADVNAAGRTNPLNVLVSQGQQANNYDPPAVLEFGKTYYWRVDEVNAVPTTIIKGEVWQFTVEPVSIPVKGVTATASSANTAKGMTADKSCDGSGIDPNTDAHSTIAADMWLTPKGTVLPAWIEYTFDRPYKLDKLLVWNSNQTMEDTVGYGAKEVTIEYSPDGTTWKALGDFEFARATGLDDYQANTTVNFAGACAQAVKLTISSNYSEYVQQVSLSEVRFYATPVFAREPVPAADANFVDPRVPLSWRAGREAVSHQVLVSTDKQKVLDGTAPVGTATSAEYVAPTTLGATYYWKVVEVNNAMTPSVWAGDVWSFTTNPYIVVDDFESYTDQTGQAVFETWVDGYDDPAKNGAVVGLLDPVNGSYCDRVIRHGGSQSMPMTYNNTGAITSEAVCAFTEAQDWSQYGITSLVLWFRGDINNVPAPLYVKINSTKVQFNNGAAATAYPLWKQWNIDLTGLGATLKSVKSLTIGIGDGKSSGSGKMWFDDILLYAAAPQVTVAADPGANGLLLLYAMEGDVKDTSGKGNNGTIEGAPTFNNGPTGYGKAIFFDGLDDDVSLPIGTMLSTTSSITVATWVNYSGAGGAWQRVWDFGTGDTNYMFLTPNRGGGLSPRFALKTASATEQSVTAPAVLTVGWHHIAATVDGATKAATLYVDGAAVRSGTLTFLPKDLGVTTQNWIGRSQFTGDSFYNGGVDEFRIYNRALSAAEVRYLAGDR